MKKPLTIVAALIALFIMSNCTKAKETVNNLDCLNKLVKLNNDSDDMTCSQLTAELSSIENSCRDIFDDDDRATIALLKSVCED